MRLQPPSDHAVERWDPDGTEPLIPSDFAAQDEIAEAATRGYRLASVFEKGGEAVVVMQRGRRITLQQSCKLTAGC